MASSSQPLPSTRVIVTGHNDEAKAVIKRDAPVQAYETAHGPWIQHLWCSEGLPPEVNTTEDMGEVQTGLSNDGTIVRVVDFPPRSTGLVHRSVTLDYIYVVQGAVTLVLDGGSRTTVGVGEAVVQQATMHGWDNETDEWARLLCVLIASKKPIVNGQALDSHVPFDV